MSSVGSLFYAGFRGMLYGVPCGVLFNDIFSPFFRIRREQITNGDLVWYVKNQAKILGIEKEVILIKGRDLYCHGSTMFPGPAIFEIPDGTCLTQNNKLEIVKNLALLKANAGIKASVITIITALAFKCLFYSLSPTVAAFSEVVVGFITFIYMLGSQEDKAIAYAEMAYNYDADLAVP